MPSTEAVVPLWAPLYRASFIAAVGRFWKKYASFDGRASYSEYWWTFLFLSLGYVVSLTLLYTGLGIWSAESDSQGPPPVIFPLGLVLTVVWFLATIVPWLALEARRLHDANKSALLLLIHLASWPGGIAVFVLTQLPSSPLGRRFDAPPGEAPRLARIGSWPAAPGEPDTGYAYGQFDAARPTSPTERPLAPPTDS